MCGSRDEDGNFNILNPLAIGKTSEMIDNVRSGSTKVKYDTSSPVGSLAENRRLLNEMLREAGN